MQPRGRVSVYEEAPGFRLGPRVKPMKRTSVRPCGGESLPGNIAHFLAYFVPRKLGTPSLQEMKACAATLKALVEHCVHKGYMDAQDSNDILDQIKVRYCESKPGPALKSPGLSACLGAGLSA